MKSSGGFDNLFAATAYKVVGQGDPMRLGEELNFYYGITRIGGEGSHTYTYPVTAGSYLSVAVAGGSVSPIVLQNLKTKLTQTKTTLESGNAGLIGTLNREDILGDMFFAGTLGYFGEYLALSHIASLSQKARHNLPIAYGTPFSSDDDNIPDCMLRSRHWVRLPFRGWAAQLRRTLTPMPPALMARGKPKKVCTLGS